MEQLWQRISEGRHTALLDIVPGEPPPQLGLRVLRVRCDVPEATLGPLHEVRGKIERLVGGAPPLLDQARTRVVSGLRRRLLGDVHERMADAELIDALNRLARRTDRRWAIVFDAVERADPATLDVLRRVVSRADALEVALVLSFRLHAPTGPAGELLAAVRAALGPDAVLRPPDGASAPTCAVAPPPPQVSVRDLPGDVLRVLRAGAIVGSGFEGELVAALLRVDAVDVLEALQRAADAGVPVEDRGEGRFHLPQEIVEALRRSILPSLARVWHRRLAALLSEEQPEARPAAAPVRAGTAPPVPPSPSSLPAPASTIGAPRATAAQPSPPAAAPPGALAAAGASHPASSAAAQGPGDGRDEADGEPGLPAPRAAPQATDTLRPPPAAGHPTGAPPGASRFATSRVAAPERPQDRPTPMAPAGPGGLPWPYADLFLRSGDGGPPSEPPESLVLDAPPDSLDAPIPGPVRVPRDLAPSGAGPSPDEPGAAPSRSARAGSLRVPATLSERAPAAARPSVSWPPVTDAAAAARLVDPARAAAESLRAAAPLEVSLHPASPAQGRDGATGAASAAPHGVGRRGTEARAAAHLTEAGEIEAAARRYRAAATEAAAAGAYAQALSYGQKALSLLDGLPATPERRRLRIGALAGIGRVQWMAAGPDPAFTLAGALEVLDAARALLAPGDPPELHAEIAALLASVWYDVGDLRSLERALAELTAASRLLLDAGDALGAARLLNDQAAVYVRMGDPVRATHLLTESRRVFEERARVDPAARVELAETDHLFARIPLHVPARPGRESDALSMGIDHALAAERTYRQVGDARELARVWETLGRLELRKGRLDRATQRLTAAIEAEQAHGDLIGLARSTAALAEVLSAKGQHREALTLLAGSMAMNLEKGSPVGLAYNRRALNALVPNISLQGEEAEALRQVAAQLAAAEAILGRLKLPGEPD
ncbi:hypothetical protein SOCEGT47_022690 [Sorangium cellulosum]|uniref:Uncharacterized protein n=1 Tax=Sorangium cellulosum TaxID=56 RepID=A0A4P2PYL3_SORCE|nr:tetratricopeptide repeat protein [Sorangium cellulosum]AUX21781.1 hypothetical protein SOCEGT47_022690 [Sorangium cellulosum]